MTPWSRASSARYSSSCPEPGQLSRRPSAVTLDIAPLQPSGRSVARGSSRLRVCRSAPWSGGLPPFRPPRSGGIACIDNRTALARATAVPALGDRRSCRGVDWAGHRCRRYRVAARGRPRSRSCLGKCAGTDDYSVALKDRRYRPRARRRTARAYPLGVRQRLVEVDRSPRDAIALVDQCPRSATLSLASTCRALASPLSANST
jgi:hypothetical protein